MSFSWIWDHIRLRTICDESPVSQKMRPAEEQQELMGVALKFCKKSSTMGKLWVSWEPLNPLVDSSVKAINCSSINRPSFRRRVQAGISLCLATLLFTLLVFFWVCSIDSSNRGFHPPSSSSSSGSLSSSGDSARPAALQGMGMVFRRGSRSMGELVVAHIAEDLTSEELRLFLRSFHRSGISARADLVLIFPGDPRDSPLSRIIDEESRFFTKLLRLSGCLQREPEPALNRHNSSQDHGHQLGPACSPRGVDLASNSSISRLNLEPFLRAEEESRVKTKVRLMKGTNITREQARAIISSRRGAGSEVSLGSITGFDIAELDPLDTLSGFLDHPPIQLRRWLCYQMLLGMARPQDQQQQQRHRYLQVLIAQVRGVFLLGDSLLAIARRYKDQRSLILVTEDRSWLDDSPRNSEPPEDTSSEEEQRKKKSKRRKRGAAAGVMEEVYGKHVWAAVEREEAAGWRLVSSAVVTGGTRAVRGLADAVATEIARVAMLRRQRRAFGDAAPLNYVLRRNANVLARRDTVYLPGNVEGDMVRASDADGTAQYDVVVAGEESRGRVAGEMAGDICGSPREISVYSDCSRRDFDS